MFKFCMANETTLAIFLLASLHNRGIHWPQVPIEAGLEIDAGVCAVLGTLDGDFDSATELMALESRQSYAQWKAERRRRHGRRAQSQNHHA